jgi:serine phosphatase RsbU (regulator of sigma subunit)
MSTDNQDLLKQQAILLLSRERELLALRRAYDRQEAWVALARWLPELVRPDLELSALCEQFQERMVSVLHLQRVTFLQLGEDGTAERITTRKSDGEQSCIEIAPAAREALRRERVGLCNEPADEASVGLAQAFDLWRFLWCRVDRSGRASLVLAAGFDRERAKMYSRFADSDVAQFTNTGHELELLLGNTSLVQELAKEKQSLERLNAQLEQRVSERTEELAKANAELTQTLVVLHAWERRVTDDMEQARLFQERILPTLPSLPEVELDSVYRPLEKVGGDIFDVWQVGAKHVRVFMADATGHGVQAAMRTILVKTEYDRIKTSYDRPHAVLEGLTRWLARLFPNAEMMCTACCFDVIADEDGATLIYSNASHPPLLLWSGGMPAEIGADGPFLGLVETTWPEPSVFRLKVGDFLLAYSDGLIDQSAGRGARFDTELRRFAVSAGATAASALADIMRSFDGFRAGGTQLDDISVIGLRVRAGS